MEKVVIKAVKRDVVGKQVRAMRRAGQLPAVIYGRHSEPLNIALDEHDATLTLGRASSSTLINIAVDGKEIATLVREKQRDYLKNRLLHVDFLAISLDEQIRATVSLHFVGVSPAVKDQSAVFVHNLESLEVECLPTDLPEYLEVDISVLKNIGDGIRVHDVKVPEKVQVLDDPETMVALASAPKVEEALPGGEVGEEIVSEDEEEPELSVERGKKEDEEE